MSVSTLPLGTALKASAYVPSSVPQPAASPQFEMPAVLSVTQVLPPSRVRCMPSFVGLSWPSTYQTYISSRPGTCAISARYRGQVFGRELGCVGQFAIARLLVTAGG